jgi:glycine dehydrogenase subunit 2
MSDDGKDPAGGAFIKHRQAFHAESLLPELGCAGRTCLALSDYSKEKELVPPELARNEHPDLPELSEPELIRHFTRLSQMSYGVDTGIYPLGSCTMKYTPKLCEEAAGYDGFTSLHPDCDERSAQGALQVMYELQEMLAEIGGVDAVTLQPAAGAHGEFTGLLLTRAFHEQNGEGHRSEVILPDTAHGTNPASAIMAGYKVVEIQSNEDGCVDLSNLDKALSENTAAFMLTNPNTLGIFEKDVLEISRMLDQAGALLYYDGANLNAVMGRARPGDMGYDIVHFNLHKTFATPHGGGGPGSGPIGVKKKLDKFLPVPVVAKSDDRYYFNYNRPDSIGKIKSYYGNFGVLVRAYAYIKLLGAEGLRETAEIATLNSNYMKEKLKDHYALPHKSLRKHEFVLSGAKLKSRGVRTLDVAKRLMDYGYHAPTIYFPLLVEEALMVEPTESEPKEEMDGFIAAMKNIAEEPEELLHGAPHNMPVRRIDEVWAARHMILSYRMWLSEREKLSQEDRPRDPQIIGKE